MPVIPTFAYGVFSLALVSILYEPLRNALYTLGDEVGGVGGVGGLTNQFIPPCYLQNETKNDCNAPYYFSPGWMGFTPFAAIVLSCLIIPLFLAAIATYFCTPSDLQKKMERPLLNSIEIDKRDHDNEEEEEERQQEIQQKKKVAIFSILWYSASSLWFLVPLLYYASSPFYQTDIWHHLLAVTIAAAFPLSWHLTFVTIPSASAPLLSLLLGITPSTFKACHVRAAWSTLFWGSIHAIGELVYLTSQGMLNVLIPTTRSSGSSDSLLYIFGFVTFVLLLIQSSHALFRYQPCVKKNFRYFHRIFAASLLLIASAHWWPFAIFLMPAVVCAATSYAIKEQKRNNNDSNNVHVVALAFIAAIIASVSVLVLIWAARQAYSLAHPKDYYTLPLHMFPVVSVFLAFIIARFSASAVLTGCIKTKK